MIFTADLGTQDQDLVTQDQDLVTQDQGRYHPGSDGARGLFHGQENIVATRKIRRSFSAKGRASKEGK